MRLKKKKLEDVIKSRIVSEVESKRYTGCCEICDSPEDCKAGKVSCELSGEKIVA
jgi:hypothetical protein